MPVWTSEGLNCALGIQTSANGGAVRINSKEIEPGDIFIALATGRTSGISYVQDAIERGAASCIVNEQEFLAHQSVDLRKVILVPDTYLALEKLALYKRQTSKAKFIAVTGTCGKTTVTKMLFASVSASYKSFCTYKNFNNKLGVLINLASIPNETERVILELGMSALGEISELASKTLHHVALITNIGPGHIANLGTLKNVALAKAEIFESLTQGEPVIIPSKGRQSKFLEGLAKQKGLKIYTFGTGRGSDARIVSQQSLGQKSLLELKLFGKAIKLETSALGLHNAENLSAALLGSYILGADLEKSLGALAEFKLLKGRGEELDLVLDCGRVKVWNRAYNANPLSIKATLEAASKALAKRKVLAIGDMLELGKRSASHHKSLAPNVIAAGINKVITVGEHTRDLYYKLPPNLQEFHVDEVESAFERTHNCLKEGDLLIVQGSCKMKMSELVSFLLQKAK